MSVELTTQKYSYVYCEILWKIMIAWIFFLKHMIKFLKNIHSEQQVAVRLERDTSEWCKSRQYNIITLPFHTYPGTPWDSYTVKTHSSFRIHNIHKFHLAHDAFLFCNTTKLLKEGSWIEDWWGLTYIHIHI